MRKLLIFVPVLLFGCSEAKKEKAEPETTGKYVYIDKAGILHTKQKCSAVFKSHNMQAVNPILPEQLTADDLNNICSRCVTEKQYDKLVSIVDGDTSE